MRMWRLSVLAFWSASFAHSEFLAERLQQRRIGRRQPQLDLSENSILESFEFPPQFIQKGESKETQMRECGEGHKGLLTMAVDNSEPEAAVLVHAQLSRSSFAAFTGATLEKEFKLKDVQIPLETVDDRCFLVKLNKDFGTVFCAREKEEALEQRMPVAEPSGINIHL
ncbi:hypothetical protein, conserved [Eimeria necatrix]|uniref:Uncharacterized protein n=1 Tax=Eimeria necatrix TaxID=51315 RepID=U6MLI0_9EIME|nr:hypothetical protein, conserved [Eimeria necatrix]CDJ63319.1 hypothetical protein, conserved [Eimeria necatrix]